MADDKTALDTDDNDLDLGVATALRARFGKTRRAAGPEPRDLEEVALYVEDALPAERRAAVEARLGAEPELRQVVDELARLEQDGRDEAPSNVVPFVVPAGRSLRVGTSGPGTLRALPTPEKKKNPMRTAILGIGVALALAAVLFLVTRPRVETQDTTGAGVGSGAVDAIAIGFSGGEALLEVDAGAPGQLAVLVATPEGTRAVGLCSARACLVTNDSVALRAGKNQARAVVGTGNGTCAFVLALTSAGGDVTSERSAAHVDPHAAAKALGTVVSKDGCVLESMDRLKGISGARHLAFIRIP